MEKYISKDAIVAEVEKLQLCTMDEHMNFYSAEAQGEYNALAKLESFIDTLEVKEVDYDIKKRIKECPFRQVACSRYEDTPVECDGRCSWVCDYPKLKELKAQKGE